MTIYVCQELEQNRASLQQKRDGGGDPNLCGGLWGAPPTGAGSRGEETEGKATARVCSLRLSPRVVPEESLLQFILRWKCLRWKSFPRPSSPVY